MWSSPRPRLAVLVAVCLALLGAALVVRSPWTASVAPADPPPAEREQTLAEALAQPHGHAAG
ncbi:MAG: hypothetical protein M3P95_06120, partial [Actinomycetota bacterium]|nr:hypothetical protein [Actinomycetota bacterium]